jgi:hypothetical protein
MGRNGVVRRYFEEYVGVGFGKVAVKNGDLTPLGKEGVDMAPT